MIDLIPVQSTAIAAVGYDENTRILVVLYNSGRAYEYHGVPAEVYAQLRTAESKGRYINREILGVYPFKLFRGWKSMTQGSLHYGRWSKPRRWTS